MTTYNLKLYQPGAVLLHTPTNSQTIALTRTGIGTPFNISIMATSAIVDYLQTESSLSLTTEDYQNLELD